MRSSVDGEIRSPDLGVYVIKTKRKTNGYWYKIRIGKFADTGAAKKFAQSLVDQNIISNYFLVSVGGQK